MICFYIIVYIHSVPVTGEIRKKREIGTKEGSFKEDDSKHLIDGLIMKYGEKFSEMDLIEFSNSEYDCKEKFKMKLDKCEGDIYYFSDHEGKLSYDTSNFSDSMKGLIIFYMKLVDQSEELIKKLFKLFHLWKRYDNKIPNLTLTNKITKCNIVPIQIKFIRDLKFQNYILTLLFDENNYKRLLNEILDKFDLYIKQMLVWDSLRAYDLIITVELYGSLYKRNLTKSNINLEIKTKLLIIEDLEKILEILSLYSMPVNLTDLITKKSKIQKDFQSLLRSLVLYTNKLNECQETISKSLYKDEKNYGLTNESYKNGLHNSTNDVTNTSLKDPNLDLSNTIFSLDQNLTISNIDSKKPLESTIITAFIFGFFVLIVISCVRFLLKKKKGRISESIELEIVHTSKNKT